MQMNVGDVVRLYRNGEVGIVLSSHRKTEVCGPEGDFMTSYHYTVLFPTGNRIVRSRHCMEVISETGNSS